MLAAVSIAAPDKALAAESYTVNSTADSEDTAARDACANGAAGCTLRAALALANSDSDSDAITVEAGVYLLQPFGAPDELLTGDLDVTGPVTITGAGFPQINGHDFDRVFDVHVCAPVCQVTIRRLAITEGFAVGGGGGGGGIRNAGLLAVDEVEIFDNDTSGDGGGIQNLGTLVVTNSSIMNNRASDAGSAFSAADGSATLRNVTISDNSFPAAVDRISGSAVFNNVTIAFNEGFGLNAQFAGFSLSNTLVADNTFEDCEAAGGAPLFDSLGHNLDSDGTCAFSLTDPSDIIDGNADLGPLQDNGGPTVTRALGGASDALDAGSPGGANACEATDQRGEARPSDGDGGGGPICDIGAFELAIDADGDSVLDATDNCKFLPNIDQVNTDGDNQGDACDADDDNDGQTDLVEQLCGSSTVSDTSLAADSDGDGQPNCIETDDDSDGWADAIEAACGSDPTSAASTLADTDSDAVPDCLDPDDDGDGWVDAIEVACASDPLDGGDRPADSDGDGAPDCLEDDDDDDGQSDAIEAFCGSDPTSAASRSRDRDADGLPDCIDEDKDGDGSDNALDNCPFVSNPGQENLDRDGRGDACDASDNRPTCQGQKATIWKQQGTIIGTAGLDVIVGSAGADTIQARGGDDIVCARGAADLVVGGAGDDSIEGEGGPDIMRGGPGQDSCDGGNGSDVATGCETKLNVP
ncbi:MAG: choice-of-anchor Q domain-containing protein [Dehalococcoidia bacterium]